MQLCRAEVLTAEEALQLSAPSVAEANAMRDGTTAAAAASAAAEAAAVAAAAAEANRAAAAEATEAAEAAAAALPVALHNAAATGA